MDNENVVLAAPLFATMDESEQRALLSSMTKVELNRGEVLFDEGENGESLYIIEEGKIKLGSSSGDGRENLLAILGPGEMFGELSLFDPGPRSLGASAVSDSVLYELEHSALVAAIEENPGVAKHLLTALARRLRRTNEALADLVFSDVLMPGMNGIELGERVRQRYPALAFVLTSGYNAVMPEQGRHGFELIPKPYTSEVLVRVFHKAVIEQAAGSGKASQHGSSLLGADNFSVDNF